MTSEKYKDDELFEFMLRAENKNKTTVELVEAVKEHLKSVEAVYIEKDGIRMLDINTMLKNKKSGTHRTA